MVIPETFVARMRELHGAEGDKWVQSLPLTLNACTKRFDVRLTAPFSNLSWNLLIEARQRDQTPAVLKLGFLKSELVQEMHALQAFADSGAVLVVDADENLSALLLEHVDPGTPLSAIEDDLCATEIFTDVFERLHVPIVERAYPAMPTMREHFAGLERYREQFSGKEGLLPSYWVERGAQYLNELIASTKEELLLHGDLHHDNILLQADGKWVVIDPKGITGDAHFDVIQYLLNYRDRGGDTATVLQRRIALIANRIDLDPRRIAMWGVARGVLEACWVLEDGGVDWRKGIQLAEEFATCMIDV